jgi:hypothetical protein
MDLELARTAVGLVRAPNVTVERFEAIDRDADESELRACKSNGPKLQASSFQVKGASAVESAMSLNRWLTMTPA